MCVAGDDVCWSDHQHSDMLHEQRAVSDSVTLLDTSTAAAATAEQLASLTLTGADASHSNSPSVLNTSSSSQQSPVSLSAAVQETTPPSQCGDVHTGLRHVTCAASSTLPSQSHAVSTASHLQPTTLNTGTSSLPLPDFTSMIIPWREYPRKLRERQYDAVVISTDEDVHIADTFRHILTEFITLDVRTNTCQAVAVDTNVYCPRWFACCLSITSLVITASLHVITAVSRLFLLTHICSCALSLM